MGTFEKRPSGKPKPNVHPRGDQPVVKIDDEAMKRESETVNLPVEPNEIGVVTVKPGDIVVVRYEGSLLDAEKDSIRNALKRVFPACEVGVLDMGAELQVYRKDA